MTNEEIKKALKAVMFLSEFCYTQDECKDCIFGRDDACCILQDDPMDWQIDDRLTELFTRFNEENGNDQT